MKPILLLLLAVSFSCTHPPVDTNPDPVNDGTSSSGLVTNPNAAAHKLTYLALGDSYTIGESVPASDRWAGQLAGLLRQRNVDVADPDIIARTGWTTAELQNAITKSGNQKEYDLVSLLIGVNNQYRGQSLPTYRAEFRLLLQTAIAFADGKASHVVVLSIPDWGYSPFAQAQDKAKISKEIDQFNAVAQDECQRANVAFVNITPATRQFTGNAEFAPDGLHYSGLHMRRWAEQTLPVVKPMLAP